MGKIGQPDQKKNAGEIPDGIETILLIDDEYVVLDLGKVLLGKKGTLSCWQGTAKKAYLFTGPSEIK